jgi:hypothetical protein
MTTELRKLIAAATNGPWSIGEKIECAHGYYSREITWNDGLPLAYVTSGSRRDINAAIIVYLVNRAEVTADLVEAAEDAIASADEHYLGNLKSALAAWKEIK